MAKHRQSRRSRPSPSSRSATEPTAGQSPPSTKRADSVRNRYLDWLRGLAIGLMVLDHIAGILFQIPIEGSAVRLATRLSMPLFCVLMGYFFNPEQRFEAVSVPRWSKNRLLQIAVATFLVNLLFWPYYQCFEILGSLLVAYALFLLSGRVFPIFVLALLLYPDDPLRSWFDYPPTMAVSFVAQGMVLRRMGIVPALISGTFLASGTLGISLLEPLGSNHKLCLFILPATLLVYGGERLALRTGNRAKPAHFLGLDVVGRHPLSIYVAQYYVIFAIAYGLTLGT